MGLHPAVLWLTPAQCALVLPVVEELKALTAEARAQARRLESFARDTVGSIECPLERFPLGREDEMLSAQAVADLLGIKKVNISNLVTSGKLVRRGDASAPFHARDVEKVLIERSGPLWTVRLAGEVMPLSRSLFITYYKLTDPRYEGCRAAVAPLKSKTVQTFLGGAAGQGSHTTLGAYVRLAPDLVPPGEERSFRTSPHAFRRLTSTAAYLGGLPRETLATWLNAPGGGEGRTPYIRESAARHRRGVLSAVGAIVEDPWCEGRPRDAASGADGGASA